jgi:hypothetical protein
VYLNLLKRIQVLTNKLIIKGIMDGKFLERGKYKNAENGG